MIPYFLLEKTQFTPISILGSFVFSSFTYTVSRFNFFIRYYYATI
jgi:hypothetical protein